MSKKVGWKLFYSVSIPVIVLLLGASEANCACLDRAKFTGALAEYSTKPDHKAIVIYLDYDSFTMNWSWSRSSGEEALNAAKANCAKDKDPSKCIPVAIDNQKTAFDPSGLFCDSNANLQQQQLNAQQRQQEAQQEQQNFQTFQSGMQTLMQGLGSALRK